MRLIPALIKSSKILLIFSTGTLSSLAFATPSPQFSPALSSSQFSATSPTEDLSAKLSRYDADDDNDDDADDDNRDNMMLMMTMMTR